MYSVLKYAAAAAVAALAAACGNSGSEAASGLYTQAEQAYSAGNYQQAIDLIDSIKSAYPEQTEIRKKGLHLSRKAMEGLLLRQLSTADSTMVVLQARGDSLKECLTWVNNPIEGYYVAKGTDPAAATETTGVQARMSPEGMFYLVSCLKGRTVNSTSVSLSAGGESASTSAVPFDRERNDRSMGAEVITFITAECEDLGRFASEHRGLPLTLTFNGSGSYSMPLPAKSADAIATVYECAKTRRDFMVASMEKERLSRSVDIARSQAARTFVETDSVSD